MVCHVECCNKTGMNIKLSFTNELNYKKSNKNKIQFLGWHQIKHYVLAASTGAF